VAVVPQRVISASRVSALRGDELEPTTLEEQDRSFGLDPKGQWASTAAASSEYRPTDYSASRATGPPDVTRYGDNVKAWATVPCWSPQYRGSGAS
jgi:hypothetical protein